jgi:hypothetical protein
LFNLAALRSDAIDTAVISGQLWSAFIDQRYPRRGALCEELERKA